MTGAGPGRLAEAVRAGDPAALARAITLVESTAASDERAAAELLQAVLPATGGAWRVGVTGVPGAGKSTFLDVLGARLCAAGRRVAVLAIDPTSQRTGGSILGDKTRMERLAREPNAFVRPSPGGATLGGIAARTREALLLCEAAGFDVVFVETIGIGQGEVQVTDVVDTTVLLTLAGAGDELQGIKRGILEHADVVVVHKADGANETAAQRAEADLAAALALLRGGEPWPPPVLRASSVSGAGVDEVWRAVERHRAALGESGLRARRRDQDGRWFDAILAERLEQRFLRDPVSAGRRAELRRQVCDGALAPGPAVTALLAGPLP